ncbi:hypothetical protein GCM10022280_09420 [Sphingomonas swuensis]|uniref:Uncharacterized protein n=1 Tax=Sphingomonas swuensis TaxID=977800 RepID=A0ABP7SLW1_9SPHN
MRICLRAFGSMDMHKVLAICRDRVEKELRKDAFSTLTESYLGGQLTAFALLMPCEEQCNTGARRYWPKGFGAEDSCQEQ